MNTMSATRYPKRRTLGVSLVALLTTLVGVHAPKEAFACSPTWADWNPTFPESGPSNGVIVVTFSCYSECDSRPEFTLKITDKNEQVVSATVLDSHFTDSGGWIAWKPESPLGAGEEYGLHLERTPEDQYRREESWTYAAVGDGADTPPSKPAEVSATASVRMSGEELCCERTPQPCSSSQCFFMPEKGTTRVHLSLTWFDSAELNGQFLVSGEFSTAKESMTSDPEVSRYVSGELAPAKAGDEYCYTATAKHLATGKETTIEGCIPAEDVELPDAEAEVANNRSRQLAGCFSPPVGMEGEWCEASEAATESGFCGLTYNDRSNPTNIGTDCTVAAGSSRNASWLLAMLGLVTVGLTRRRRDSV